MEDYPTVNRNKAWIYNPLVNINTYDPTVVNATAAVRAVKEAEWKRKLTSLENFNNACAGVKYLIIYRVVEDAVVAIKQRYVGYGGVTPNIMMQHIRDRTCIKLATLDKANFKKNGHNTPWYATSDINIYWKYLYDLAKNLKARDISTSGNEKFSVAVSQMWESNYFIE